MHSHRILISVLALAAISAPAWATTCTGPCLTGNSSTGQDTTDRTTFESANSGLSFNTFDFTGLDNTYNTSAGLLLMVNSYGVQMVGSSSAGFDLQVANSFHSWTAADVLQVGNGNGGAITISIPSGLNVLAIAFDLALSQSSFGLPFDITVDNGSTATYQSAAGVTTPGSVFVGISSASPITSITISNELPNPTIALDNLEMGTGVAQTPETATFLLIGGGLMMMRFFKKRDKARGISKRPASSPVRATEPQPALT